MQFVSLGISVFFLQALVERLFKGPGGGTEQVRAAVEHACADTSAKRRPLRAGSGAVPAGRLVPRGPGATAAGTCRLWRRQQRLAARRPLAGSGRWPVTAARGTEGRAAALLPRERELRRPRAARPGLLVQARRPPAGRPGRGEGAPAGRGAGRRWRGCPAGACPPPRGPGGDPAALLLPLRYPWGTPLAAPSLTAGEKQLVNY